MNSRVKCNSFWSSFVYSVVQLQMNSFVTVVTMGVLSCLNSLLGLFDFSLSDINVSVVDPH